MLNTLSEAEGRILLQRQGIAVTPGELVTNVDDAMAASLRLPGPWVVKLGNAGIAQKGRVGGVRVGLCNEREVAGACRDIAVAAVSHGVVKTRAEVKYLVQQMMLGPELLVTLVRDPIVGPSITVGMAAGRRKQGWSSSSRLSPKDRPAISPALSKARSLAGCWTQARSRPWLPCWTNSPAPSPAWPGSRSTWSSATR